MTPVAFTPYKSEGLRGLPPRVLEQYGIGQTEQGIAFDYRDRSGTVIARKWRDDQKNIRWQGNSKEVVGFGWHLANPERQDAVAITEGEFDAPSIYAATNSKVVGVSVPNGAQSAANLSLIHI